MSINEKSRIVEDKIMDNMRKGIKEKSKEKDNLRESKQVWDNEWDGLLKGVSDKEEAEKEDITKDTEEKGE